MIKLMYSSSIAHDTSATRESGASKYARVISPLLLVTWSASFQLPVLYVLQDYGLESSIPLLLLVKSSR